ncbi:MAG TPA: glycerophosphodiester phosphodiesterase [Polyangiaceae bacterium]
MAALAQRPFLLADRPLGFAHRGGAALWPENTLVAFEHALALGCRYLETDVHVTRDGKVVVLHDAQLGRTTDGAGLVAEHTYSELCRLDAGHRFSPRPSASATRAVTEYPWRGRGLRIPRFEELLELSGDALFNVELKSRDPRLAKGFWELVETHGLHDRVLVAAAIDPVVRAFRQLSRGRVATSASRREVTAFWAACRANLSTWIPVHYDALQVPTHSGRLTIVDRAFITAAHARGLDVHVWTIDDAQEMRALLELGVDGLMSDRPDQLREVLNEYRR